MTLDKHAIGGISPITSKILPAQDFDTLLTQAGYSKIGTVPLKATASKLAGATIL